MICRLLFVLLSFFFWPLCCLFSFDIRILINLLVSSNSSYQIYMSNTAGALYGFTPGLFVFFVVFVFCFCFWWEPWCSSFQFSVSLDCPFLIASWIFSNVFFRHIACLEEYGTIYISPDLMQAYFLFIFVRTNNKLINNGHVRFIILKKNNAQIIFLFQILL